MTQVSAAENGRFVNRPYGPVTGRTLQGRPFIVGIHNGFMPCGPLQSMWIVALAGGSSFAGAFSMLLFSLGTVPLMLGLGSLVSLLRKRFNSGVMSVGAVLVVVLGLSMLSQGGSLSGLLTPEKLLILAAVFSVTGVLLSLPAERKAVKFLMGVFSAVILAGAFFFTFSRGSWFTVRLPKEKGSP